MKQIKMVFRVVSNDLELHLTYLFAMLSNKLSSFLFASVLLSCFNDVFHASVVAGSVNVVSYSRR